MIGRARWRTNPSAPALALALTLGPSAAAAAAQEAPPPEEPRTLCFDGAPRPACATFLVVELQGVLPVLHDTRVVRWHGGYEAETTPYADRLQWELGLMHNVSDRWAVGGAARLGSGSTGALTGLTLRVRRWLSPDLGLDVSTGATFTVVSTPVHWGRATGFLADARLNFQEDVYAGVRFEQVPVRRFEGAEGVFDPGGDARALSLLLGLGSEWAVGGSAVIGAALLFVAATVDWS